MVHKSNSFWIFGGKSSSGNHAGYTSIIARYCMKVESWFQAGRLNHARSGHGAIELGSNFLIVGGAGNLMTEKCEIGKDNTVECTDQQPSLDRYVAYPELFHVPNDFCS